MKKILIVEDSEAILDCLVLFFEVFYHYAITTAHNGKEGFEKTILFDPHIIITDYNMPVLDGIRMTGQIRKIPKNCPIILMSGQLDRDLSQKFKKEGGNDLISKPFSCEKLAKLIEKYL